MLFRASVFTECLYAFAVGRGLKEVYLCDAHVQQEFAKKAMKGRRKSHGRVEEGQQRCLLLPLQTGLADFQHPAYPGILMTRHYELAVAPATSGVRSVITVVEGIPSGTPRS